MDAARRATRGRSLLQPLQRLATDFRDRMRAGLVARGHVLQPAFSTLIVNLPIRGARPTELAARAGITKQAMGKLVDSLEAIGYVERVADPVDGRAKLVRFSERGLALLRDSGEIVDEIWQDYAARLGPVRLRRLHGDLGDLVRALGDDPGGEATRPRTAKEEPR